MLKPVTLTCGHSGCKSCLERVVVGVGEGARPKKCPVCRVEMPRQLCINVCLDKITRKLPMHCSNIGCEWRGIFERAEGHQKECGKRVIPCKNNGCQHVSQREQMAQHDSTCPKLKIHCHKCGKAVTLEDSQLHESDTCAFVVKECPLGCGERFPRCNIHLHQQCCQSKAVACQVKGCKAIKRRGECSSHALEAALSHQQMQHSEIQRLRTLIDEKKSHQETVSRREATTSSFKWEIHDFKRLIVNQREASGSYQPLSSSIFHGRDGFRWKGLLQYKKDYGIYLQLVSAVNPVTTEVRIVLKPGVAEEAVFKLKLTSMKEGQNFGRSGLNLEKYIEADGSLVVKFIIIVYNLA